MEQGGIEFSPISEGNEQALLQKSANGELVLYAAVRRHEANLHALPWVKVKRQSSRCFAATLAPVTVELVNTLLLFPEANLEMYLAADPSIYPDTHPLIDHLWMLDEPQTVTRKLIYFRCDDGNIRNIDVPAKNVEILRVPISTQQEEAILTWLKGNSHDPHKLPIPASGKPGIKKRCRDELCETSKQLFLTKIVFNVAWVRLRANNVIKDAE